MKLLLKLTSLELRCSRVNVVLSCFLFLQAFALYNFTGGPDLSVGDAGELIAAAWSLGSAHPPGYPGWALATRLFLMIPMGSIAARANVASAGFAAFAISLFFLILCRVTPSRISGFAVALWMSWGNLLWSQAVIGEVYALNAGLTVLVIHFVMRAETSGDVRNLYLAALCAGIGLTNHQTLLLVILVIGLLLVVSLIPANRWARVKPRTLGTVIAAGLIGLSVYLVLPLRAMSDPTMNWGDPDRYARLMEHVTRSQYGGFNLSRLVSLPKTSLTFLHALHQQLPYPLLGLAVLGFLWCTKADVTTARRFGAAFLVLGPAYLIALTGLLFGEQLLEMHVYYIPGFLCLAVGLNLMLNRILLISNRRRLWTALFLVYGSVFGGVNLYRGITRISEATNYLASDYGREMLRPLELNAVIYAQGDFEFFSGAYLQAVEKYRTDVVILDVNQPEAPDVFGYQAKILGSETIYATNKMGPFPLDRFVPEYLGYRVTGKSTVASQAFWRTLRPRLLQPATKAVNDYFEQMIWGGVHFFNGARLIHEGKPDEGLAALARSSEISAAIPQSLNNIASILAEHGYEERAIQLWNQAITTDPEYTKGYNNLGIIHRNRGNRIRAVEYFERSLLLNPAQPKIEGLIRDTLTQKYLGVGSD